MARLTADAARFVPFYRAFWARAGLDLRGLELPRDFGRLPVVRKADLLAAGLEARLDERSRGAELVAESSSGTSGQPFEMRMSAATVRRRRLRFVRALIGAGYRPGERLMFIADRRPTFTSRLLRWTYAGLEEGEAALAAKYLSARPAVLYGPLSTLLALGDRLAGLPAGGHRPRLLVTTAEELGPLQRRALSPVFGERIVDFYGMTELGLMAWRKGRDEPYRTASRRLLLEFLPYADDADLERLVVTDLAPAAMPMIRYETGDLVRRDRSVPGAPIVRFVGREIDCLRLPGGLRISPYRIEMALEGIEGLEQYQVLQSADLSVEVCVRTSAPRTEPIAEAVRQAVNYVCDGALPLRIKMSSGPGWPAAGKLRLVRSLARDDRENSVRNL